MSGSQQLLLGGNPQAVPVDPYFYSVTSLLHGDGTNGGQNNTFLDSSTNNFTITRNGNTTQGSFSPFSQTGWSNYFDGSGDYLTSPNNAAIQLNNSTAFTLECWFNAAAFANQNIFRRIAGSAPFAGYGLATGEGGAATNTLVFWDGSAWRTVLAGLVAGQWYHFAATYEGSGTTLRFFVNGIQQGSALTCPAGISNTADTFAIGAANAGTAPFTGYVSNLRIVKGTAVYTSNFTVPTTPLTAITNTSLLTCQANRFLDASSNNFTITRNGDVSVQPFSPFNPITAYSTSAVGGSGYFDGSGDYLSVPDAAAFTLGTSDFCMESWVYPTNAGTGASESILGQWSSASYGWIFQYRSNALLMYYSTNGSSTTNAINASATVVNNAWNHIAFVRSGNTLSAYVNGVRVSTNASFTASIVNSSSTVNVGRNGDNSEYVTGYLNGTRLVVGSSVYDPSQSSITVPTAPLTAITNTSLLCNFTNGAIFDNAAVADYETVGNAQISTSVKKYGTGSIAFDGTGDKLVTPFFPWLQMGSSDWTIEMWVYLNSAPGGGAYYGLYANRASTAAYSPITIFVNSARQIEAYFSTSGSSWTSTLTTGQTIPTTTWTHVAVVKIGTLVKVYFNGNGDGSTATISGSLFTNTAQLWVGGENGGNDLNGYIDDFRISKGVARYPYNFTPPTAEFPNIGGTVTLTADPYFDYTTLLLPGNGTNGAQNNTFLDSSTNAFSITRNGNTTQGTFSPFSQTGWGNYFDGTGDYLTTNATQAIPATGDFTVDGWIWCNSYALGPSIISQGTAGTSGRTVIYITAAGKLALQITSTINEFGSAIPTNQWVYFAITRTGSTVTGYINGSSVGTATNSGSIQNTTLEIGGEWNGDPYRWIGYLSNIRVSNVVRTITAAPTAPFTSDANTVVLTCQSNRFIDASSNAYTITRNGDVSVQAFSPFNPTAAWSAATNGGSGYFDGSGDYLTAASNAAFALGTGDFCIEGWYFVYSNKDYNIYFDFRNGSGTAVVPYLYSNSAGDVDYYVNGGSRITASAVIKINQWSHIAVIRSGTDTKMFINGVQVGSTYTDTNNYVQGPLYIGRNNGGGTTYDASYYCSGFRVVKGTTGGYGTPSSTITVPTAPKASDANTSVLLNYTNAGIYDATSKNDLETVGNAQISTTQSKFGGSSMYFDGTGDWLAAPPTPQSDLGSGDFTIEAWLYRTASGATFDSGIVSRGAPSTSNGFVFAYTSSNVLTFNFNYAGPIVTGSTAIPLNTWTHVAVTRYGSTFRLFVNGLVDGSATSSSSQTLNASDVFYIGRAGFDSGRIVTGYLNDVRLTKGIARYTSNFTPPTTAFLTL